MSLTDREFFDVLFQQFAKTTRAEDTYWMNEKQEDYWVSEGHEEWQEPGEGWDVFAADKDGIKTKVGNFVNEVDADFITAIHGCLPDLVRRMHDALDEADRADKGHDEREQQLFRLSLENQELREELEHRKALQEDASAAARNTIAENDAAYAKIQQLEQWLADARSKAADALWKIERPM